MIEVILKENVDHLGGRGDLDHVAAAAEVIDRFLENDFDHGVFSWWRLRAGANRC